MGTRTWGVCCLLAGLVVATSACGDNAEKAANKAKDKAKETATTITSALESGTRFNATLTGASEVPGPGDPDGAGTAMINLDVSKSDICYEVTVQRLDRPTAMHIHEGEAGKAGNVVVTLTTPAGNDTPTKGCVNADAPLIGRIAATPRNFYVNVHTDAYPQGAVRGQLS